MSPRSATRWPAADRARERSAMRLLHVTPRSSAESILRHGFEPRIGLRSVYLETEPATYFFTSEQALSDACWNWLGEAFEDVDEDLIVLVVDVDERLVHVDLRIGFEAVVFDAVPASVITRAYDLECGEPVVLVAGPAY